MSFAPPLHLKSEVSYGERKEGRELVMERYCGDVCVVCELVKGDSVGVSVKGSEVK